MSTRTTDTSGSSASLSRSSAVMAGGTLASRLLGVGRIALLAEALGGNLTAAANVWETANTIPNTIFLLLAAGVLNILLLPQLTRSMTRGEEGQDYSDRLLTLAVTVLVVGTVLFTLAAPLVTRINAVSWGWGDPKLELAILFAYLCIPQMLFYGLHTTLGQVLAAHQRFAAFMWSPALANAVQIVGILVFIRRYPGAGSLPLGDWTPGMVWLLAGSATLGIALQALVLFPAVRATGFRWRPRWGFRGVGLGTAGVMALWAFAEVGLSQGGMLVVSNLLNWAVDAAPGSPGRNAHFSGFSVFMLPHSLLALSLLTAMYPVLSRAAAVGDLEGMARQAVTGMKLLVSAMVPISIGLMLLAPLVVRIIFPFSDAASHSAIADIARAFSVGLVPYGLYLLCSRVFYSFEDARTPFGFQVGLTATLLLSALVAFVLLPPGAAAVTVALGQAVGQLVALGLGLRAVRRRLPSIQLRPVLDTGLRAVAASVAALLPAWVAIRLLDRPGTAGAVLALGVAGVAYLLGYAALALLLGVGELRTVLAPVLRRVPALRGRLPQSPAAADLAPVADTVASPPTSASAQEAPASGGTLGWDDAPDGVVFGGEAGDMERLEVGTRLGDRYLLEELLAERDGGGLQYWSARDTTLDRLVAVTVLPSTGDAEVARVAEAVLDGARRVASVDDPRLVRVLDVGEADGLCWIIEEGLSEAESLASLVEEHPLPAEEVRRLVGETSAGLESARRRGLHHLYLNPHSVLRTSDGTVKISGVGVASALEGTDDVTADEASLIDAADLVSLLYTGLTGRWPGEDLPGVRPARRLADGTLPAPSELVAGIPGDLDALCRLVHGSSADLSAAPHTPGELARQLSPWSPDIVHGARPGELTAPAEPGADPRSRATDALTGVAGAAAAATAAHPTRAESGPADPTTEVPRPYYRTEAQPRGGVGSLLGVREDDDVEPLRSSRTPRYADDRAAQASAAAEPRGPGGPRPGPERPDGSAGLREERGTPLQSVAVIALILGIVGVAALLGWGLLRGLGGDDTPQARHTTSAAPAAGSTDGSPSSTGPTGTGDVTGTKGTSGEPTRSEDTPAAAGTGGTVAVRGITSFDPQGDGDEHSDLAPLAVDGDPGTAWTSHTYLSSGWGSLKTGTGLILDLGEGATVGEVETQLTDGEMGVRLLLADQPSLDGATELGADDAVEGTWTVTPEKPVTGRYLIVWFDQAATTDEGEIAGVREITVR